MQTMAMQLGGHVEASNEREFGYAQVEVVNDSALVRGIEDALTAESTTEENSPRAPQYVFEAGVPVFGVWYGMQTMAMQLGGNVEASNEREFGYAQVEVENDSALVRGIEDALTADGKPLLDVWMSHGDKVTAIPSDFVTVASTESFCHYG